MQERPGFGVVARTRDHDLHRRHLQTPGHGEQPSETDRHSLDGRFLGLNQPFCLPNPVVVPQQAAQAEPELHGEGVPRRDGTVAGFAGAEDELLAIVRGVVQEAGVSVAEAGLDLGVEGDRLEEPAGIQSGFVER